MDKVIYGDNQFLGVNHQSETKASKQKSVFSDPKSIESTLDRVNEIGIKSFMFTTHDMFEPVFLSIANKPSFNDFKLYPCLPYAHKYANAMADLGLIGSVKKFVGSNAISAGAKIAFSGITANPLPVMKLLVDSELRLLRKNNVSGVFLQNIVTDLLIGLGGIEILAEFRHYIQTKYNIDAGFITMNYTKLTEGFRNITSDKLIVCSSINKLGFRMNPSQKVVEDALKRGNCHNIAMSALASGAIKPEEAFEYIGSLDSVGSVLFGASSEKNIISSKQLIERYLQ